jgi:hypothetical protein
VEVIPRTIIRNRRKEQVWVRADSKIELLPTNHRFPDGKRGIYLPTESRCLLLGYIKSRGPYVVKEILKPRNGQVLLSFTVNGKEIKLRSINFRLAK